MPASAKKKGANFMPMQIFRHALMMVYNNLAQALRLSVGPYAILLLASVVLVGLFGGLFSASAVGGVQAGLTDDQMQLAGSAAGVFGSVFVFIPLMILGLFVGSWVAVSWHRFILLEEATGFLPPIKDRPIWPYLGRNIVIGFLIIIIGIPLLLIASLFSWSFILFSLLSTAVGAVLVGIWFALGMSLPGIAVGKTMSLGETFALARPHMNTIIIVAVMLMVFNFVIALIAGLIPIIGGLLLLAANWLSLMLAISILTTLHGHIIENRPLMA
jgi:hypothetical protein